MRYWWVCQNKTHNEEVTDGFMWSPKVNSNGARNQFYDFMTEVEPGDVVFSYFKKQIRAIGIAAAKAISASKPVFENGSESWSDEGWYVKVDFERLTNGLSTKQYIDRLRPLMPTKYAPLDTIGNGNILYLTSLPDEFANELIKLIGEEYGQVMQNLTAKVDYEEAEMAAVLFSIKGRTDIGATEKEQLVKSRRGQGIFKTNVRLNEKGCRVTGVTDSAHLRASHIKPWRDSTDEEKLNGCNGLLLAPHIDHLFDRGLISFEDNGDLLVSPALDITVLSAWGLAGSKNVGPFNTQQQEFLEYHRNSVLRIK